VGDSKLAFEAFVPKVKAALDAGQQVWITLQDQ
jgi:hypothetical protein